MLRGRYWLYYSLTFLSGRDGRYSSYSLGFLMVEKFGYSAANIAALFLINHLFNFLFAEKIGILIGRFGERRALTFEYVGLILVFVAYAFVENGYVAAGLYVLDHMFFALAIAIKTYFQKIADPADIASTAGVSFTINHIAAVGDSFRARLRLAAIAKRGVSGGCAVRGALVGDVAERAVAAACGPRNGARLRATAGAARVITRAAVAVAWVAIVAGCAAPPATVETAPAPSQAATADLLYRAVNLMESRKYDRAVAVLTRLVEQQPPADAGATHYLLGSAYAAVNDYASAATHYALAAAGPGRLVLEAATLAHLGAGHYAYRAGRYEDAVRHLAAWRRSATQTNPSTLMELAQAHSTHRAEGRCPRCRRGRLAGSASPGRGGARRMARIVGRAVRCQRAMGQISGHAWPLGTRVSCSTRSAERMDAGYDDVAGARGADQSIAQPLKISFVTVA